MTRESAITHLAHKIIRCKTTGESKADGVNVVALEMATTALEEQEPKWNPIKTRPMDEEEREEWSAKLGYKLEDYEAVIYTSLPDEGQDVLICLQNGVVTIDALEQDDCGCYFVEYGDIEGVVAWMPLPEPWKDDKEWKD